MSSKMRLWRTDGDLVMDTFIRNMNNKTVQERLCTEQKANPQDDFRFVVAKAERINYHKTFEGRNVYKKNKARTSLCGERAKKNSAQDVA